MYRVSCSILHQLCPALLCSALLCCKPYGSISVIGRASRSGIPAVYKDEHYSNVQCVVVQYSIVPCSAVQHSAMKSNVV